MWNLALSLRACDLESSAAAQAGAFIAADSLVARFNPTAKPYSVLGHASGPSPGSRSYTHKKKTVHGPCFGAHPMAALVPREDHGSCGGPLQ